MPLSRKKQDFSQKPLSAYYDKLTPVGGTELKKEETPPQAQPVSFLDSEVPQLNVMEEKEFLDFEVVLDSGAADHVVDSADTPGYSVQESAGSKAGACFVAANGERIPQSRGGQTGPHGGTYPHFIHLPSLEDLEATLECGEGVRRWLRGHLQEGWSQH